MLLDPGDIVRTGGDLQCVHDALESLQLPYVEVHDESDAVLELSLRSSALPIATVVINGDLATSFQIALGIALRMSGKRTASLWAAGEAIPLPQCPQSDRNGHGPFRCACSRAPAIRASSMRTCLSWPTTAQMPSETAIAETAKINIITFALPQRGGTYRVTICASAE